MPPLIVFIVGLTATVLFMTLPLWLALTLVVGIVCVALFRLRHLARLRERPGLPPGVRPREDSVWPFFWNPPVNPNSDPGAASPSSHHHHHHHHHPHAPGGAADAGTGGHSHHHPDSSSFSSGDAGGHHGGGGDFGGGGGHH